MDEGVSHQCCPFGAFFLQAVRTSVDEASTTPTVGDGAAAPQLPSSSLAPYTVASEAAERQAGNVRAACAQKRVRRRCLTLFFHTYYV